MAQHVVLNENFLLNLEDLDQLDESSNSEMEDEDQQLQQEASNNLNQPEDYQTKLESGIAAIRNDFSNNASHKHHFISDDPSFLAHIQQIKQFQQEDIVKYLKTIDKNDPEYNLILKCSDYSNQIDKEMQVVHKQLRDLYQTKFPELESLVLNAVDYAKCVQLIQNETDLNKVDMSNILSSHLRVTVQVAGSSTTGKNLPKAKLAEALHLCEKILHLEDYKQTMFDYVENKMHLILPNLTALVGTVVAARMLAAAGGLDPLSRIPACNLQVMGGIKKNTAGLGKQQNAERHMGFFSQLEDVRTANNEFQKRLVRMYANSAAKCIRIDQARMALDGKLGQQMKSEMLLRYNKIQEPPPPKKIKPLIIYEERPKRRRGGKKYRKIKEKMGLTDVRLYTNKLSFGPNDAELEYRETGKGFGMYGTNSAALRITAGDNKLGLTKKQKKLQLKQGNNNNNTFNANNKTMYKAGQSGGGTSGMASSVVFDNVQGMQLLNPDLLKPLPKKNADNYFSKESGFKTVMENRSKEELLGGILGGQRNMHKME